MEKMSIYTEAQRRTFHWNIYALRNKRKIKKKI
jgi:hypothetical protein